MPVRPLLGLIFALVWAVPAEAARALLVGSFTWTVSSPDFGGISGIDLFTDGMSFRAVEDTGFSFLGRFERDGTGRVTAVRTGPIMPLRDGDGRPLGEADRDAEGLALGAGGSFFVSFERSDRVIRYAGTASRATLLTGGTDLTWLAYNKGLEALAADADGTLYAIAEQPGRGRAGHTVLRRDGTRWTEAFEIPADGTWRVTGADFGPDGKLYVLQRDFWGLVGFRTRVLRLSIDRGAVVGTETLLETRAGRHDNLEGIAVWRDATGNLRLTLVSDDNRSMLQRTEVVDYRIEE